MADFPAIPISITSERAEDDGRTLWRAASGRRRVIAPRERPQADITVRALVTQAQALAVEQHYADQGTAPFAFTHPLDGEVYRCVYAAVPPLRAYPAKFTAGADGAAQRLVQIEVRLHGEWLASASPGASAAGISGGAPGSDFTGVTGISGGAPDTEFTGVAGVSGGGVG